MTSQMPYRNFTLRLLARLFLTSGYELTESQMDDLKAVFMSSIQ